MISRPVASAVNLLEMKIIRPHPRPNESETLSNEVQSSFSTNPQLFRCVLKFENHSPKARKRAVLK